MRKMQYLTETWQQGFKLKLDLHGVGLHDKLALSFIFNCQLIKNNIELLSLKKTVCLITCALHLKVEQICKDLEITIFFYNISVTLLTLCKATHWSVLETLTPEL